MKIKSERDFWSGLLFMVVGAGFAIGATNHGFGSAAQPGPAALPFGLGLLLAAIGALLLFKALTLEHEGGDRIGPVAFKPLLVVLGSVALFGWLLPHLGLVPSVPLLVVAAALAGDRFRLGEVLAHAAVLTLACWAVFVQGLGLALPLWPAFPG
jgi:hypothetical protein